VEEHNELIHTLRARYSREISELKDNLVGKYPTSFTIRHKDITDKQTADNVVIHKHLADIVIKEALISVGVPPDRANSLTIRYLRIPSYTPIRGLTSEYIGQTRTFEGIIRRVSDVKPKVTIASFECSNCGLHTEVNQEKDKLKYPESKCESCRDYNSSKVRWTVDISRSSFIDSQTILVQEYPEGLRGGEQPQSVIVEVVGDLCGKYLPGQRVLVAGVLRARSEKSTDLKYESYIECNSIELKDELYENITITEEELKQIEALSKDSEIFDKIVSSIAPTIYGSQEVKQGVVLQLFGGVSKIIAGTKMRGDIHILLVGDPGIAKSVIMKYVVDLSPRGIFTHGNSSTKAGLTASAVKDGDDWVLEAGALVLADKGLCAVDEIDKMSDQDREALHGAMEQQEIDVAKAGIIAKLLCRCSLLGAANPKHGRFDSYKSLSSQLNLPPTLLSRFDLIYPMMDIPDKVKDKQIKEHIFKAHTGQLELNGVPKELLKKYIAHAKSIEPVMSEEALDIIGEYYLTIRGQASDMGTVPITARSLEALIRLCEAAARMRLSKIIDPNDARLVVSIVDGCLRQIAYDQSLKTYDADKVIGKYPRTVRNIVDKILIAIHNNEDDFHISQIKDIEKYMKEKYGIEEMETQKYLEFMKNESMVFYPRIGLVKELK